MAEENSSTPEEKIEAKKVEAPKAKPNYLLYGLAVAVVILAVCTAYLGWQYLKGPTPTSCKQRNLTI